MKKSNIPNYTLIVMILSYSISLPFPKNIGLPEAVVGATATMLFITGLPKSLRNNPYSILLLCALLLIGLLAGAVKANKTESIVRDVIPLLYFSLPFVTFTLFKESITDNPEKFETIIKALILLGFIYSTRECLAFFQSDSIGFYKTETYMLQAPCVLFALIISNYRVLTSNSLIAKIIYAMISITCILPLYFSTLRAPIALAIITPLGLAAITHPKIMKPVMVLIFALLVEELFNSEGIFEEFIKKQETYGSNNKLEELYTVLDSLMSSNIFYAIFGKGWGATWYSPAVRAEVNYAHSLITYGALKLGILGVILSLLYSLYMLKIYIYSSRIFIAGPTKTTTENMIIMTAAACSLLVGGLLESAYKTLDFGIVTLTIFLAGHFISLPATKESAAQ